MDKFRKELIEVVVAVEVEDPRLPKIIERIKNSFNPNMEFKYQEHFRREMEKGKKT